MRFSHFVTTVLSTALLVLCACSKAPEDPAGKAAPATAAHQHGKPGAVAGSHEDWCAEHAVPESRCTRCDLELVAAFKATGDWCAEHGLPESQCVQCDPSRKMVRPPAGGN